MSRENYIFYKQSIESKIGQLILNKLKDPEIKDISLNPDGTLWEDRIGKGWIQIGTMDQDLAKGFLNAVASFLDVRFNYDEPILQGELPNLEPFKGERIQAMMPPNTPGYQFTIRKPSIKILTLFDYVQSGALSENLAKAIELGIEQRKNILIAGGTATGKTTLANAILEAIARITPNDRLYIIEDTVELRPTSKNYVATRTSPGVDEDALLVSGLRNAPKRIILSEIRRKEAFTFLDALNTGHEGGLATIHANSCLDSLYRLENILKKWNFTPSPEEIAHSINMVIHIKRGIGAPKIHEVGLVSYKNSKYIVDTL
jgi:type IV secretion system protein VirB11